MSTGARPKSVKKRVRNVPSRYMQAAEEVSLREKLPLKSSKEMSRSSSQDISGVSKLSTSSASSQEMTSTPVFKATIPFPPLDESAVTNFQNQLSVPTVKERIVPRSPDFIKKNIMKQKMTDVTVMHRPVIASHKEKNSFDENLANAEMDLLYAQYLQSLFLVSEAKIALEKRSSAAVETLYKLLVLVQQHLDKAKSQKDLLKVMTTIIGAHEHCQKQHEILKPVFEVIPDLDEKYKSLAKAIDATKHKLNVKDVILPDSNEIQENLQKMSEFLISFFQALPSYTDFNTTSDVLMKYVDFAEHLTDELKRGVNLLTKAQELYISEASLALGCENL